MCGTVPRVVHFVFGLWEDNATLSSKHHDALLTWRRHNPEWAIQVWRRRELDRLFRRYHPAEWSWIQKHITAHGHLADLTRSATFARNRAPRCPGPDAKPIEVYPSQHNIAPSPQSFQFILR